MYTKYLRFNFLVVLFCSFTINAYAQGGTLPLNGSLNANLSSTAATDTWNLTTTGDGLIRLTFQSTGASNEDLYVSLYDNNGTILVGGPTESYNNAKATLSVDGLAAGTYRVKVTAFNSGSVVGNYTLSDSLFTPAQANDVEPNNSRAQASVLPVNNSKIGHVGYYYNNLRDSSDWYKVTTNADGLLRVTLSTFASSVYSPKQLDANVFLYDNDGVTQLGTVEVFNYSDRSGPATASFITDGLAAGTYYIKVQCYYPNSGFAAYSLSDSLLISGIANDMEPDSSRATALVLPLNDSTMGHIGYYYSNHRDSTDWYKVTTNADGLLRIKLSTFKSSLYSPNQLDVNVYLYDKDGVTQLGTVEAFNYSDRYGPATDSFSTDGLAAGTYYIKVQCYNPSTEFADYVLSDSLLTYNANDIEPNDSAYEAKTILSNRTTTGHISFYKNGGSRDASDWVKINYTGTSGNLQFKFNLLPHVSDTTLFGDVYFEVYKDTTASPIFNKEYYKTSPNNIINLTSLDQGYYYIHIIPYDSNPVYFAAYSLADSFTQVNKAQISLSSIDSSSNLCGVNKITYNLSGSHSPYTVRLYRDGLKADSLITTLTTASFSGLNTGHYYATVYGDGATDSAYSKSVTTILLPPHPTGLYTTSIGVHTATLNWTPVSCVQHYVIEYKITGTNTWTTINTSKYVIGNYPLGGLAPYTKYTWQIASFDSAEVLTSRFSDTANFKTLSDTAHIVLLHAEQTNICSNNSLQYTFSNSAAPYTVQLYRNGIMYGTPLMGTSTVTFTALPSGNYYATATGTGSGGSMGKSDNTQLTPPVPTGLDSSNVSANQATVKWNALSCANYFTVQYRLAGTDTWTSINTAVDSVVLSGLTFDMIYEWRVASIDSSNGQIIMSAYSVIDNFRTHAALPVTLTKFNGVLQNGNALLTWSTATESNNKGFELQKSIDGKNFTDIAFVAGNGNSSLIHNYQFTDENVLSGSNYYRLKQMDLDGRFILSPIIKLDFAKFAWNILGNPISSNSMIQMQIDKTSDVIIQVVSMNGSVIQVINKGKIAAGTYTIPLNLGQVSSGIYMVQLILDGKSYSKEIFK